MANTVQERFRDTKPGTGRDSAGSPRQGKVEITGRVTVTSYNSGESLTPADLGLTTIDFIHLEPEEGMGGASGEPVTAHYSSSAQEFYVVSSGKDTSKVGDTLNLFFHALGDSSSDVELT